MDLKAVKKLIDLMKKEGLTTLEITEKDGTGVKLCREATITKLPAPTPIEQLPYTPHKILPDPSLKNSTPVKRCNEVKSPLIGVFYTASSPNDPPFIKVGSKVKRGDVLCIIEAMKQMNEITADADGEVIEIALQNGDIVEYDQVMFKLT
jgi:acetyl-CoA carboxylase biotin carboxyl carrier protein